MRDLREQADERQVQHEQHYVPDEYIKHFRNNLPQVSQLEKRV
jgi:hypothetical protein